MSSTTTVQVRSAVPADRERWDRFVEAAPAGTFFHRYGWRNVLERAFGHATHYLVAERGTAIVGVLPLGQVKSLLFGNALISTPFCVYGGPVAIDAEAQAALIDASTALAARLGVDYLEMRNREPLCAGWPAKDLYVTFRRPITASDEENLKAIPRKQRAMVRKGIDGDLVSTVTSDVDGLWRAYSESVRNLGTPVFGRAYLRILKEEFGEACEVVNVTHAGKLVASVMNFYFRDEVLPYYGGGIAAARDLYANDFMYWEVMRRAAARGVRLFDYGRSKRESGSYRFKKHWGFTESPLSYQYHLVKAKTVPNVSPTNPRYRLMVEGWKRLPLAVSRWLGPWLARNLG